ncbi:MAG: hypothetical protein N3C12_10120 [Candidatus Binatia bacterium]|nr:hypothetical protein [Candidatus Binatia bacterium]
MAILVAQRIPHRTAASLLALAILLVGGGVQSGFAESTPGVKPPKQERGGTPAQATPKLNAKQQRILKALVGRWKIEDGEDELEFRADGSFLGKSHAVEMTARYEVSRDGQLIIDLGLPVPRKAQTPAAGEGGAKPTPQTLRVVREVRFEGKKLVLRDRETGQTFRYVRLP